MMSNKGERTRQHILEQAVDLFNTKGYGGTSFSDIIAQTGVQKGGIYNHFANKTQLELEAFDLAVEKVRQRSRPMLQSQPHTLDRIKAVVTVFETLLYDPVIVGGCPVLNAAIEADGTSPALLARAQAAMDEWRDYIIRCAEKGQARGEIALALAPEALASIILSALEGAIVLHNLYADHRHMAHVATFLYTYLESLRLDP